MRYTNRIVLKNILTDSERKNVLKYALPRLVDGDELYKIPGNRVGRYPGKQTEANLHRIPYFNHVHSMMMKRIEQYTGHNYIVKRSWINWTNGDKKDVGWHCHDTDLSVVYYIKIPLPLFSNGTLFRDGFVKAPQNSLLIFPSHLEHSAPSSPFRFDRYTLAMDLLYG
tara:strand:+ start:73 stop:576 length:504 start_codon:yes stop_codon:yes gene_type:complete